MKIKIFLLLAFFSFFYFLASVKAATVTPFSSPENSFYALTDYLGSLNQSVYISGYTFTSLDFAGKLAEADKKGLDVKLLLEDKPVGEKTDNSTLCFLESEGVEVYLYKGGLRFLHAKYIIGDNKSISVGTENFGESGISRNRGWGAIVEDPEAAWRLLGIYLEDLKNSEGFVCNQKIEGKARYAKPEYIEIKKYGDQAVSLILAPDAVEDVISLINSANKSLYIEQFYIYKKWRGGANLFLETAIGRARKGVDVKILMDSTWYNVEEGDADSNYNTAQYVKNIASMENIPIEAKLADLEKIGVEKIHVKGMIIDNRSVFVSSINWNENSPRRNREIGALVSGESAKYFLGKFVFDWDGSDEINNEISGKVSGRDYTGIGLETLLFVLAAGTGMILVKRKFYS